MAGEVDLRAPFPWYGGKRRAAHLVWPRIGADIPNFIDPFVGSLAVLLLRPGGPGKIETVNDKDGFVCNVWRSLKYDPDGVAEYADWPVSELDLHARHLWLVNQLEFKERMRVDPDFYDVKIAGWWLWGICQWIGGGWCRESNANNHKKPRLDGIGKGIHAQNEGLITVPQKLPMLAVKADGACAGRGIHSDAAVAAYSPGRRPQLSTAGQGMHLPSLGNDRGLNGLSAPPCRDWFRALQERLRRVRVACGDFERVLGDSVLGKGKNVGGRRPCGVFLDPPYDQDIRSDELYAEDERGVSRRAFEWAVAHGDDPELRIAFCGYAGEHQFPADWEEVAWKASRGYAGEDNQNRELERIWFSPHCLKPSSATQQMALF